MKFTLGIIVVIGLCSIIEEWVKPGRVKDADSNVNSDKKVIYYPGKEKWPGFNKMIMKYSPAHFSILSIIYLEQLLTCQKR